MRLPLRLALAAALLAPSLGFCESVEEAKDLSGADWGESLEPTAAVQAASAPGAGASARGSAAALAASSWKRRRSPLPVPPRGASKPVDAYGTPRMIALTLGGYAAGFAAMLNLGSWTLPIALAFVPIGAAFAAQRALARGERGRPVVMAAIKGAALGLLTGPPLAGAWLGAKASDLIDRCLNRR